MKATDLMIGDYVWYTPPEWQKREYEALHFEVPKPHIWKVDNILRMANTGYDYPECSPLPITESFIQNNFKLEHKDLYELTTLWGIRPFHDHWQVCLLTMDEFGGSWAGAFEVRYVHEVQQFLRLLKVEKEVEI